jgi:hypothetical protein
MADNVPLSSVFIIMGLVLLSAVVANRAKGLVLFGLRTSWIITISGAVIFAIGIFLQLESPSLIKGRDTIVVKEATKKNKEYRIYFDPKKAVWGHQVRLKVMPAVDKVDVYLNDNPLPSVSKGDGVFMVTIPSISKSGFFTISIKGLKIKADEKLEVFAN